MLSYLENFSDSFLLAIVLWPFASVILTLPLLLLQLIWFKKINWSRSVITFLVILYGLALLAFTLYPLPQDMTEFCQKNHLLPQLNPFEFISDIQKAGIKAILQNALNVIFFLPFGLALRNFLGMKLHSVIIFSILLSLLIETMQLTAVFGIFECSYRLFDVDDVLMNTIGGILGYFVGFILPNFSRKKDEISEINLKPKLIERLIVFWADMTLVQVILAIILAGLSLLGFKIPDEFARSIEIIIFGLLEFTLPLLWNGKTIFSNFANISLDDLDRKPLNRFIFYAVRAIILGLVIFGNGPISFFVILFLVIFSVIKRKPPYCFIK